MIVFGIIAILMIAVAAAVGWGVGVTVAKSRNNNSGASESTTSMSQHSLVSTGSSYVSWNLKTCGSLVKRLTWGYNSSLPTPSSGLAVITITTSIFSSITPTATQDTVRGIPTSTSTPVQAGPTPTRSITVIPVPLPTEIQLIPTLT